MTPLRFIALCGAFGLDSELTLRDAALDVQAPQYAQFGQQNLQQSQQSYQQQFAQQNFAPQQTFGVPQNYGPQTIQQPQQTFAAPNPQQPDNPFAKFGQFGAQAQKGPAEQTSFENVAQKPFDNSVQKGFPFNSVAQMASEGVQKEAAFGTFGQQAPENFAQATAPLDNSAQKESSFGTFAQKAPENSAQKTAPLDNSAQKEFSFGTLAQKAPENSAQKTAPLGNVAAKGFSFDGLNAPEKAPTLSAAVPAAPIPAEASANVEVTAAAGTRPHRGPPELPKYTPSGGDAHKADEHKPGDEHKPAKGPAGEHAKAAHTEAAAGTVDKPVPASMVAVSVDASGSAALDPELTRVLHEELSAKAKALKAKEKRLSVEKTELDLQAAEDAADDKVADLQRAERKLRSDAARKKLAKEEKEVQAQEVGLKPQLRSSHSTGE